MSKQCKIVGDLLPLYHDGVCSDESRQMVEDHLSGCSACRGLLKQIDREVNAPAGDIENLRPLDAIKTTIRLGRRKSVIAGIAIALTAVVLLLSGWGLWWYVYEYSYYLDFTEGMTPLSVHEYADDGSIQQTIVLDNTTYTYTDTYSYDVTLPVFLTREGKVVMSRLDGRESITISRWKNVDYVFHVFIERYGKTHYFIVDSALQQYYPDHWPAEVIGQKNSMLAVLEEEVRTLVNDAVTMWPFIKNNES